MIWIALSLNHDVEIVTAGHLIRLVAINAALPGIIMLGQYFERRGFDGLLQSTEALQPEAIASSSQMPSNTP